MKKCFHPPWLIIATCTICQGQIFLSPVFDLTQQVTIKRATARAFLNLSVGFEHNKNTFLTGPVIQIAQFDQVNPKPPFVSGGQYTHRYSFTDEGKKLRFFGEVISKYQKVEEEWISNYWSADQNKYSSFGLGYYISSLKPDDPDEQPVLSNRDYRGYRNNGIFYNIQIGIALLEGLKPKNYVNK